jgi:hypothetical protein
VNVEVGNEKDDFKCTLTLEEATLTTMYLTAKTILKVTRHVKLLKRQIYSANYQFQGKSNETSDRVILEELRDLGPPISNNVVLENHSPPTSP